MKVLLTHRPGGAYGHISESWLNTLIAAGHDAKRWDGELSSWQAFKPDLYIGCSGHRQPIPAPSTMARGNTHVVIHVNPYCDMSLDGINEPRNAINWTLDQKPVAVFGYGFEVHRHFWSHWENKHGIKWVPMPTAGDSTMYGPITSQKNDDAVYVGGYWPYKAKNIDAYLLASIKAGLNVRVYGWGDWPVPHGQISDQEVPLALASAKVGPCISEPHTSKWGIDLPERLWKVMLSNTLAVHDPVFELDKISSSVIMAHSTSEYFELCRYYASSDGHNDMIRLAAAQRREVLNGHTYFHRLATLFEAIEDDRFAAAAIEMRETCLKYQ